MQRLVSFHAAALVLLAAGCATPAGVGTRSGPDAARSADSLHVRVLATHDLHGALQPQTYPWSGGRLVGGAAALKAHMDSAEAACACPTFRVDGGDQLQGTLESNLVFGASVVAAFNVIGLDAAAVGNHELDWGTDTLRTRQAESAYPWLAANVFLAGTDRRPEWARPYAILEREGARLAVIGYATESTPATLRTATTVPYEFRGGLDGIRAALDEVRAQQPDFTIVVAHAGGGCREERCEGEMADLARSLDPAEVHLIAGGHDHGATASVVNGIPIVRGSSHARGIAIVDLVRRGDGSRGFSMRRDTVWVDAVQPDSTVLALVRRSVERADSIARLPIAMLRDSLPGRQTKQLGQLITDALRHATGADFALSNTGGIRAPIAAGPVTYNDVFRVLPFGNEIVRMTLTGEELREVLEVAVNSPNPDDVAGLRVTYDPAAPVGGRVRTMTRDDGTAIRDTTRYTLAVPDYLADGGGGYRLLGRIAREDTETAMLDALIAYLRSLPQPAVAPAERRVVPIAR
jgi:2',3'-cyclic-nucleotide 2'-phosphodiesterase (5'-nucleotidase family)